MRAQGIGSDTQQLNDIFSNLTSRIRERQQSGPAATEDTVRTSALPPSSDKDAASALANVQRSIPSTRADALSVHSGLDYSRAMKLLEGL